MILVTEIFRQQLHLPVDCGIYDLVKDQWQISEEELRIYRPDLDNLVEKREDDEND